MHYVRYNRLGWRRIRADAGKKCKSSAGTKHSYKTALSNYTETHYYAVA